MIGKVGMTGITTTPHLHFQVDNSDAPFHAYWPYSFQDLRSLKIDFFEAVNVGLGKENAMKYTVNPMEFVQKLVDSSFSVQAPVATEIKVASNIPTAPQNFVASVAIPITVPTPVAESVSVPTPALDLLMTPPELAGPITTQVVAPAPTPIVVPVVVPSVNPPSSVAAVQALRAFQDVSSRAVYAKAASYLKSRSISLLQGETMFRASRAMTRREAVLYLA